MLGMRLLTTSARVVVSASAAAMVKRKADADGDAEAEHVRPAKRSHTSASSRILRVETECDDDANMDTGVEAASSEEANAAAPDTQKDKDGKEDKQMEQKGRKDAERDRSDTASSADSDVVTSPGPALPAESTHKGQLALFVPAASLVPFLNAHVRNPSCSASRCVVLSVPESACVQASTIIGVSQTGARTSSSKRTRSALTASVVVDCEFDADLLYDD